MKSTVMMIFLIIYLLLVVPCFAKGSEQTDSEVYEIDYRGPETHNSRPPPETMHGKPPYIHHNTSAAGLGAHVGGKSKLPSPPLLIFIYGIYVNMSLWFFKGKKVNNSH
ncbi:hypothetical protein ISN45_At05g002120 [Arabidopsis thaliana x Arabidopsis arenosa]|uniref:Transmembrane protein n=1 Tax=Arabidopsis thaliana x Arabidopsis arenosa TaxID=1240361 RepID=A0A8T2CRL8_9BRAS|nr:hypothetical protein ISN45_At05g002120 [Arabidopsis thaliana x Arabidopsis arenosa]